MKTYSVAIQSKHPYPEQNKDSYWITNWNKYSSVDDVDWDDVKDFVDNDPNLLGYGYYYGHQSSNLTAKRCRTVLYTK